ncbi:MAG: cytochrome P450 [Pseudomonadales bacterium]
MRANAGTQLGFGAGIHHCLGANLAREEMYQAFTRLLARTSDLRLVPDMNDFSHHPSLILRGLKALHIEFDR